MTTTQQVGERIRHARREAGFTRQEAFAVALGVSTRTVERWERGESQPTVERIEAVAKVTGKSLSYFFEGVGTDA